MAAMLGKVLLMLTRPLQPLMPRMKPKLIIIGAQKAGTTTLYDLLAQHPQVIPPKEKEVSFFNRDDRYRDGMGRYWSRFPKQPVSPKRLITIEASPHYLYSIVAAERIARHLPRVICVAVLRDPVARSYSAWNMYREFRGHERYAHLHDPRSFEQAVEDELAGKPEIPGRRYLANSRYAPQLRRFVDHLGRDRLHVYGFKQLVNDAPGLVNDLLARVGLSPLPADDPAFKVWSNKRSYPTTLSSELKARLRAYFAEDEAELKELLGQVPDYLEDQ
jgi:hypothetical protein